MSTKKQTITIQNEELCATFLAQGAETLSLCDLRTSHEYLWWGDERWWHGTSPILFPITGGMWNGRTLHNGGELRIPKHGFASKCLWRVVAHEAASVTFALSSSDDDVQKYREAYPFRYEVRVRYTLDGRTLRAEFFVENREAEQTLYFQMGGHPGIALPDWMEPRHPDGYLKLEGTPRRLLRAGEQGCIEVEDGMVPRSFPVPLNDEGLVELRTETLANEALIFDEQVTGATVLSRDGEPVARVTSTAPVWLFWSPQGIPSPFICCEPWYGLPDLQGFEGEISERPYIQSARAGQTWQGGYAVEVF